MILLFLHRFDFNHIRQNNCQNTANQYLCQERYWPFYTSLLDMSFIEDCHSSIYWLVSTAFLTFMGSGVDLYYDQSPRLSHDFHRIPASTHISNLSFSFFLYWREFHNFLVVWHWLRVGLIYMTNPSATFLLFSWVLNSDPHFRTIIS